ncbi:MAG: hypothetical protein ABIO96_05340 [Nitrospiraceae bacterium]
MNPTVDVRLHCHMFHRELLALDHRTTASQISTRCSFGSVTVSESVSPGPLALPNRYRHLQVTIPH